jgi:ATP-binding cassette subfamily B protein
MDDKAFPSQSICDELRIVMVRAGQVWRLVPSRHKWALGGAAVVMALTSLCNIALPLLLGKLVDSLKSGLGTASGGSNIVAVASFCLGLMAGAYLLREVLNVGRRYVVENSCTRIEKDISVQLVSHLMKLDLSRLTHERVGALHGRIQRSIVGFVRFLRLAFLDFFPVILTGFFALSATLAKQPALALVMTGVIPISLYLTIRQLISQKGVRLSLIRSREVMDGTVVEQLASIEYVRVADTHRREVSRVDRAAESRRATEIRHHFQMSLFGCAKALNEGFFHILVLSVAVYFAATGSLTYGDVLTVSLLFMNVMTPLSEVHRVIDEAHETSLQVADLLEMLAEPVDRSFVPPKTREPVLDFGKPLIVVEDLRVEYPSCCQKKPKRALDGITVTIRHGERIGVAGPSGGGKSTWLRVLMRLTHPCGGKVSIGGVPLENLSRESIGRLVGFVGQSPFVFAGTIEENIAYGCEDASREAIREAARRAYIHDEIVAMPAGYQAQVAERGQNLSGGQKQRIALARVFLKNPPILILDEGTSALDNISERWIQRALQEDQSPRTIIMVAHRLSTLVDTDRILVFDRGRIVDTGSFNHLALKDGLFNELVRSAGSSPSPPPAWAAVGQTAAAFPSVMVG